jgi:hypothetical protein
VPSDYTQWILHRTCDDCQSRNGVWGLNPIRCCMQHILLGLNLESAASTVPAALALFEAIYDFRNCRHLSKENSASRVDNTGQDEAKTAQNASGYEHAPQQTCRN